MASSIPTWLHASQCTPWHSSTSSVKKKRGQCSVGQKQRLPPDHKKHLCRSGGIRVVRCESSDSSKRNEATPSSSQPGPSQVSREESLEAAELSRLLTSVEGIKQELAELRAVEEARATVAEARVSEARVSDARFSEARVSQQAADSDLRKREPGEFDLWSNGAASERGDLAPMQGGGQVADVAKGDKNEEKGWLEPWDVPWGGKELGIGMGLWVVSFLGSTVIIRLVSLKVGWMPWRGDMDEQSINLLLNQVVRTGLALFIVRGVTQRFRPFPDDVFHISLNDPFSWRKGWLLWALLGLAGGAAAVQLSALATTALTGGVEPERGEDALLQVLPLIAFSPWSTACLITVAGFCAPVLEEIIFRSFFFTTLTKWMPVVPAALLSGAAFSAAHLTPGEFPMLASLGFVLGLAYARTRNLATPILIHASWNSGILIILTILRSQGIQIEELL